MTILFSAPCMASSGPNPYGQPQAPASVLSNSKSNNIYHNNNTNNNDNNQQISATNIHAKTTSAPLASGQQMPHDGGDKPLVHPANFSLLANNYDGYIAGMSSDSELTAGGPTSSRHHHHYHHRPYSSQSRVYHAHPVPKTSSGASSRMSHYSDSAAAAPTGPPTAQSSSSSSSAVAGSNSFAIHQHQKKQQPPISNQAVSMTSPANVISSNHQSSMAPSGASASSSTYLAGGVAGDSPLSPVMHQQQQQQQVMARLAKSGAGRQLPQRPFKQSMSIDHQSIGAHQYQQMGDGSPVHHGSLSSHRNLGLGEDSAPMGGYQAQSYLNQQHFGAGTGQQYGPAGVAMSPRSLRLEMAMMEKQTANMNIYDAANDNPTARLPPTASGRPSSSSSSSTSRQLPSLGTSQAQGLLGSMSLDQQHHQVDPFHQQSPQHHQQQHHHHQQHQHHQEPYASHHQQVGSASTEWLPPVGSTGPAGQHNSLARPSGHFKQTLSIDHYAGLHHQPHQHHQQYSPARNQHFVGEHYGHQSGPYSATPLIGNYDSSAGGGAGGADQASYYSGNQESQSTLPHETYYQAQHKKQIVEPGQHQQQQQITSTSLDYPNVIRAPSAATGRPPLVALQARQINRPTLHHQVSDSSSNSNQSGSLKSSNLEDGLPDKQTAAASGEHQKSISSSSSAAAAAAAQYGLQQQHQSPQHKATAGRAQSGGQHRPDMLRRGYTSLTMGTTYGATDLGDSQTALSESGDMSSSGGLASGSHAHIGLLAGKRSGLRAASPSMAPEACTSSGQLQSQHHHHPYHQVHQNQPHHSSSSAYGGRDGPGVRSESSTGLPNGSDGNSTLTKKSNSTTQLSMTGSKKRLGFRKKQVTSFSVHRSEEVAPLEARHLVKQGSSVSEGDSSISGDSSSRSWSNSNFKQQTSEELASMSFIDGLGKGQMISRQGLASPYLGDIQLSLCDRRGNLEVEVIRARNLQAKTNKVLPLTYVKLYLVKNRKCLAKAKTTLSNKRTLNPLFQQQLTFHEDYHGCILQSIVWGNFGKMDKKNFMGIAQISIDDLELSDTVISWYKLFLPSSLQTLPSKSLRHTLLSNSTESFTNTNNS